MRILEHRIGRQYQATIDRVTEIAEPATALVERHMRGCIGHVEIAVTTSSGLQDMVSDADRQLLGVGGAKLTRWGRHPAGQTSLTTRGTLVVINAQVLRGNRRQIDKTVVHELVHAAQFAKPGRRDEILRDLRNNYRLEVMTRAEVKAANRQVDQDEREAERLERLARQL